MTTRGTVTAALLLALAAVLGAVLWMAVQLDRMRLEPLVLACDPETLVLEPGTSFAQLAERLTHRGWVEHPRALRLYARATGLAGSIQAGEYAVEPGMSLADLLAAMAAGEVRSHSLTVVEGWTYRELLAAVAAEPAISHTLGEVSGEQLMEQLGHPDQHPEGRFLPETYRFPRGTTDLQFLGRAYQAMQRALQGEWRDRAPDLPYETPYQALIMASIIEKETGVAAERPQIAGVFVRRLRRGMRLQTDPTVIYGLGEAFDGDLRYRDLRQDTPYNTYTRGGLPPTPIALPGRAAIHAALHPADGDALYFVSRGDGSHVFSATLEEHNRAVRRYQKGR